MTEQVTVRVAALEVAVLHALVKTARYCLPLSESCAVKVRLVEVAPPMSVKVIPSGEDCHWTVGAGEPLAAAVKVTGEPDGTLWLSGWVVTAGAVFTVSVATLLVALPHVLVKTARYFLVLSAAVAVKLRVVEVALGIGFQMVPPSVETSHCTVGAGLPLAAAVKVAGVLS